MSANQADANKLSVRTMCRVLGVSASGYYDWLHRAPSKRALANAVLSESIVSALYAFRQPTLRRRWRLCYWSALCATLAGTVADAPGAASLSAGRQLCGSSSSRSRFLSVGRRSNTSLR